MYLQLKGKMAIVTFITGVNLVVDGAITRRVNF